MKISSIALFAALAASASANPIRIYKLSPEPLPPSSIEEISHELSEPEPNFEEVIKILPIDSIENIPDSEIQVSHKPCHGKTPGEQGRPYGPLGSLLSKFNFFHHSHPVDEGKENLESLVEHLKNQFHHLEEDENEVIPFLEGGIPTMVQPLEESNDQEESELTEFSSSDNGDGMKWWRYLSENKWLIKSGSNGHWRIPNEDEIPPEKLVLHMNELELEDGERPYHHHHHGEHHRGHGHGYKHGWMAKTIGGRLHRALNNLKPLESILFAFVIGAGLGSIIHTIFMLLLITYRYFEFGRIAREERRARRAARREIRKAGGYQVRFADQVQVQVQGEEDGELLPAYEDGETARLVVGEKVEQA